MNKNAKLIFPFYKKLYDLINTNQYIQDKTGTKVVEILLPKIILSPNEYYIDFSTRKSPRKYIEKETNWYNSHSLNIEQVKDVTIWNNVSDENNEINSNYGNLVYSRNNYSQFTHAFNSLIKNVGSRQAIIIYTRPSIHYEWNGLDASDFICTNYNQFFIRNNRLITITNMRSNDCWTGTFSDIPWFHKVINNMFIKLKEVYPNLELGDHIFMPNSFHCYEKNFDKLIELVDNTKLELHND